MAPTHALHRGEAQIQKRRGTPSELSDSMPDYINADMPQQHAVFFAGLSYLPLATLDSQGRPWASLLVTSSGDDPSVGITVSDHNQTDVVAETNPYDPFVRALSQAWDPSRDDRQLFAGVGVDFTDRRRNKLAGSIKSVSIDSAEKVRLQLISDQHLGNCPKYITVRSLQHHTRSAELVLDSYEAVTSPLPEASKALIGRVSTIFLATKHSADHAQEHSDQRDMGLNHRGGAPGFVRLYEEKDGDLVTTYLVLPDHSGNRFYQSLGNIETDKQVGLVFPDFATGDVLYVTGDAENLHDAEAEAIMPRVGLLTRIQVTGAVFVKGGLNLRLVSEEQLSPYNPPIRYLRIEMEQLGHLTDAHSGSTSLGATLISTQHLSQSITTFTFELSSSIEAPLPGGFGIFDFSGLLDTGYSHMNEANPQLVNEDYVRTWTLSSAPDFDAEKNLFRPTNRVSVTVKRKPGGLMSNYLHESATQLVKQRLQVGFKGAGAGFSCFTEDPDGGPPRVPAKMLWIAGGVGVTPFMTMWDGVCNVARALPNHVSTDIVLLFSGRDDDISVLTHFLARTDSLPENLNLHVRAFQSVGKTPSKAQSALDALREEFPSAALHVEQRRVHRSDLEAIEDLGDRAVFLCGPDAMMTWCQNTLSELGVDESKLHQESFFF
jgi:ferredoxin-NADP reductase